jgi:hypothetical protein
VQDDGTLLATRITDVKGSPTAGSSPTASATPAGVSKVILDQMIATIRSMGGFLSDPRVSTNAVLRPFGVTLLRSVSASSQQGGGGMSRADMLANVATFRREMDLKSK